MATYLLAAGVIIALGLAIWALVRIYNLKPEDIQGFDTAVKRLATSQSY